jgi:hypothetical protein
MSDDFINIIIGVSIGLIIGYYLTIFGVAIKLSKNLTTTETDKTIIYTIQWEELKEENE